jgi:hypothetical protein
MKPTKILSILLTITLLASAMLVIRPVGAVGGYVPGSPVQFTVEPVAIPPLTDNNLSDYGLETPGGTSPVGKHFMLNIYLKNATLTNIPLGLMGIAIQLNFTNITSFAQPVAYTDQLCNTGCVFGDIGVTQGDFLFVKDGLYTNAGVKKSYPFAGVGQVIIGAAETLVPVVPWNETGGNNAQSLIATIEFNITSQPGLGELDALGRLVWITAGTGITNANNALENYDIIGGTVQIDAATGMPAQPHVYFDSAIYNGPLPLGSLFNVTVMIDADMWWCVESFDVNVTWDDTLIHLNAASFGTALQLLNPSPPNVWVGTITNDTGWADGWAISTVPSPDGMGPVTGSLLQLQFSVQVVGSSYPAPHCIIGFEWVDLDSWTPVPRALPPWSGSTLPVDLLGYFTVGPNSDYYGPVVTAGPAIDLYDQYPSPYGGQGLGKHSDAFAPQQNVTLYAKVTQGGYRVINKLVVFEVFNANKSKVAILQNTTDNDGIATVTFRIPMTADLHDPAIFGWWHVIATVEVDQIVVSDVMWFQVGWLVWVDQIIVNNDPYHQPGPSYMNFTMIVMTISEQDRSVLLAIDAFDEASYPIGEIAWTQTVHAIRNDTSDHPDQDDPTITGVYVFGSGGLLTPPGTKYYGWDSTGVPGWFEVVSYAGYNLVMEVPNWARIGPGLVAGYALTDWPQFGGTPYAPQCTNTFHIAYP